MAKRRPRKSTRRGGPPKARGSALRLRELPGGRGWALSPPPCADERSDDLEEVREMIEAGEHEIATDELRYLLSGCPELIDAHVLLGGLALGSGAESESDIALARGHFGFAYALGEKAIESARRPGLLPAVEKTNAPWHESARGLAWCLEKLGESAMADRVAATVKRMDPSDPAEVTAMLDELRAGGLPIVELG